MGRDPAANREGPAVYRPAELCSRIGLTCKRWLPETRRRRSQVFWLFQLGNVHLGIGDSDSSEKHREAKLREKWGGVSVCGAGSQPGGGSGI